MKKINKIWRTIFSLCLALLLVGGISSFNVKNVQAYDKEVWMQSIYNDNGNVNVVFNVDVRGQYYTGANVGYIYVKDMNTGSITRYIAEKINSENSVDTYKVVFALSEGQNVRIKLAASIPSGTGHPHDYYDDNNGYWYQV